MKLARLKWAESDGVLIQRFAQDNDGEAFSALMDRYAGMVYTTCRRILGDEAQAADASQETFFQLIKSADQVRGSLGAWLHCVATRRAVDLVRQNASRRQREQSYAYETENRASSWAEVESVVDEALEGLPEDLRELLLQHFLQGRSTVQIAAARRVSQPTISRRMTEALELVREKLRARGVQVGLVPLQTLLLHSNHVAPAAVRVGLGKLALAKAAAGWGSVGAAPASGLALKFALAVAAITLAAGLAWVALSSRPPRYGMGPVHLPAALPNTAPPTALAAAGLDHPRVAPPDHQALHPLRDTPSLSVALPEPIGSNALADSSCPAPGSNLPPTMSAVLSPDLIRSLRAALSNTPLPSAWTNLPTPPADPTLPVAEASAPPGALPAEWTQPAYQAYPAYVPGWMIDRPAYPVGPPYPWLWPGQNFDPNRANSTLNNYMNIGPASVYLGGEPVRAGRGGRPHSARPGN